MTKNTKPAGKSKTKLVLLLALITFSLLGYGFGYYIRELPKQEQVLEKMSASDYQSLYDFYISATPRIDNRPYYGQANASITIIAYIDPTKQSSSYFLSERLPQLKKEYMDTAKVKLYVKHYLLEQDISDNSLNYILTKYLTCIAQVEKEKYFDFFFGLFAVSDAKEISSLLKQHNISEQQVNSCMATSDFAQLYEDLYEVEKFNIVGTSPRFYIGISGRDNRILDGVPAYDTFQRTIRQHQLVLGD